MYLSLCTSKVVSIYPSSFNISLSCFSWLVTPLSLSDLSHHCHIIRTVTPLTDLSHHCHYQTCLTTVRTVSTLSLSDLSQHCHYQTCLNTVTVRSVSTLYCQTCLNTVTVRPASFLCQNDSLLTFYTTVRRTCLISLSNRTHHWLTSQLRHISPLSNITGLRPLYWSHSDCISTLVVVQLVQWLIC